MLGQADVDADWELVSCRTLAVGRSLPKADPTAATKMWRSGSGQNDKETGAMGQIHVRVNFIEPWRSKQGQTPHVTDAQQPLVHQPLIPLNLQTYSNIEV